MALEVVKNRMIIIMADARWIPGECICGCMGPIVGSNMRQSDLVSVSGLRTCGGAHSSIIF